METRSKGSGTITLSRINMNIWIAGRPVGMRWEILGGYTTEEKAVNRCMTHDDFVLRIVVDEDLDRLTDSELAGRAYFPRLDETLKNWPII